MLLSPAMEKQVVSLRLSNENTPGDYQGFVFTRSVFSASVIILNNFSPFSPLWYSHPRHWNRFFQFGFCPSDNAYQPVDFIR